MVEAACCALLLGRPSRTGPHRLSVVEGCPGELRGGRWIAVHGVSGSAVGAVTGALPVSDSQ